MRRFLIGAALLASGCGSPWSPSWQDPDKPPTTDACTGAPPRRECITLHLSGKLDGETIDTLQIDATFELAGSRVTRRVVITRPEGAAPLPIAAGVILSEEAGTSADLTVLALRDGFPVAVGEESVYDLFPGKHAHAGIELKPASQTRCFNGIQDGQEHGVDCGHFSGCPACTIGSRCLVDTDCADSSCELTSDGMGGSKDRCR
jgi:hypothetical protein